MPYPWKPGDELTSADLNQAIANNAGVAIATSGVANAVDFGAKCDGVTDDTAAIARAFAAVSRVFLPAGSTTYSATGITVPGGCTLAGGSFAPGNPPAGSVLLIGSGAARGVTLGDGVSNSTSRLETLIVASNATGTPTGVGVYVNGGYAITLDRVMTYNFAQGYYWKASATIGLGGKMRECYAGKIADAHIVMDAWPELRIENSRCGMNGSGDLAAQTFIRLQGGFASTAAGPNTLSAINSQFDQGSNSVAHFLEFVNLGSGGVPSIDATSFKFADCHIENIATAIVASDATWNIINRLSFVANTINCPGVPLFALNAATQLSIVELVANEIFGSVNLIAGAQQLSAITVSDNYILGGITAAGISGSTASIIGNTVGANIAISGVWGNAAIIGNTYNAGALVNTATGFVNVYDQALSGNAVNTLLASPPAIGGTAPAAGSFTTLSASTSATVGGNAASGVLNASVNGAAGSFRGFQIQTAGVNRWVVQGNNDGETGSNLGTNLVINRFSDNGTPLGPNFSISRATGLVTMSAGVAISGAGNIDTTTIGATTPAPLKCTTFGANSAAASGKITVTGSKGSNAALTSLISALVTFGLITDSTS